MNVRRGRGGEEGETKTKMKKKMRRKKRKNVVSSLSLECFRAHMFLGLRFVIPWDSFIHPTSKHLLITTKCQAPLQARLGL